MALPDRTSLYPTATFNQLIETVFIKGKTVTFDLKTHAAAHSWRTKFYRYRKLLRAEGQVELANNADAVVLRVSKTSGVITFSPREDEEGDLKAAIEAANGS